MSDLIDDPVPGENAPEFTVSELSGAVKRVIEGEFGFVRVRGEVGRVSRPRSGHVYLDLKDDRSVLAGVIWKGVASRLATQPEEGLEVVATGRLTTFPGQSRYQIVIDDIRPAGMGALMALLEKRKKALEAEGLFAPERKKAIPYLPEVIGVVTSPSGAVIRDILHRLRDRFPRKVLIWPVAVQGEKCAPEVAAAIRGFNSLTPGGALPRPDLIIVARGGGSIEDLWGFNEEVVARAAAASEIPLISAVGHETDTTLIDFVADRRAPTPTAAAEMAVPVRMDLLAWVDGQGARLTRSLTQALVQRGQRLRDLARALPRPDSLTGNARQRLDNADRALASALKSGVQVKRGKLLETGSAIRPATLRARVQGERQHLEKLGARLAPALARLVRDQKREAERNRSKLTDSGQRLQAAWERGQRLRGDRLKGVERLLETLNYKATLARGYAVVRADGTLAKSRAEASGAAVLEIEFHDGKLSAVPGTGPAKRGKSEPPEQGSLF